MTHDKKLTERQISDIDQDLIEWGLATKHRPLELFKRVDGPVEAEKVREQLFEPILKWYLKKYGDEVRFDGILGRIPLEIRGRLYEGLIVWSRTGAPGEYKEHIVGLPKTIEDELSTDEFYEIAGRLTQGHLSFRALYNLNVDDYLLTEESRNLFHMAVRDLESSAAILIHNQNPQGSIVASHEAAEKFLKIALMRSPSKKGPFSFRHDIPALFEELKNVEPRYHWLLKPSQHLQILSPNMQMRYKVHKKTFADAVTAFYGSLHICGVLAHIWLFDKARAGELPVFRECKFYRNETGRDFYCKSVHGENVTLMFFQMSTDFGAQRGDMHITQKLASLYLEIKKPEEEARLRALLLNVIRVADKPITLPGKEVSCDIVNGVEGSHASLRIRRKVIKEK